MQTEDDTFTDDVYESRETKRCGNCSHFDSLNRCCWVVASDGIYRHVSEDDYCVFGFKEDEES